MAEWIIKEKNALEKRRVKVEKTGKKKIFVYKIATVCKI